MTRLIALLLGAIALTACSAAPTPTLFAETVNLPLLDGSEIIDDCNVDGILDTVGKNITCVSIPFPNGLQSATERETFAEDYSRQYADTTIQSGWTATTEYPLFYRFEKVATDDCSDLLQIMTWVVDETKPIEARNFPTSRMTFIENQTPICGDKRKAK